MTSPAVSGLFSRNSNSAVHKQEVGSDAENPGVDSKNLSNLLAKVGKAFSSGFSLGENGSLTAPPSKWDYPGSVFFCLTVVTTIGYGNLAPNTAAGQAVCCLYALLGIPMLAVFLSGIADRAKAGQLRIHRLSCWRGRGRLPVAATSALYVLIGLTMFFILPAVVFISTEGWSFGIGMYYSLITLSTIGFGDYVAGQTYSSDVYKFSLTVWLFSGMVYVSGLINAVQVSMEKGTQAVHAKGAALQLRMHTTSAAAAGPHQDCVADDFENENENNSVNNSSTEDPVEQAASEQPSSMEIVPTIGDQPAVANISVL